MPRFNVGDKVTAVERIVTEYEGASGEMVETVDAEAGDSGYIIGLEWPGFYNVAFSKTSTLVIPAEITEHTPGAKPSRPGQRS